VALTKNRKGKRLKKRKNKKEKKGHCASAQLAPVAETQPTCVIVPLAPLSRARADTAVVVAVSTIRAVPDADKCPPLARPLSPGNPSPS
jgi:hypothetical protein